MSRPIRGQYPGDQSEASIQDLREDMSSSKTSQLAGYRSGMMPTHLEYSALWKHQHLYLYFLCLLHISCGSKVYKDDVNIQSAGVISTYIYIEIFTIDCCTCQYLKNE